jgi:hypothetical protein
MFFLYHPKNSGAMEGACVDKFGAKNIAHNVPAVYDVLAGRISKP